MQSGGIDQGKRKRIQSFFYMATVYPLYYIGAMFLSTLILAPVLGWGMRKALAFFLVTGSVMGVACYPIHFRLYLDAFHAAFVQKWRPYP